MKYLVFALITTFISVSAFAANIAIIDSGTDLRHIDLMKKAWINSGEIAANKIDDDKNGYVDDVNGWNFAENNNSIIDYKFLGIFSNDVYKFFDVQYKMMAEVATDEDKAWYKAKKEDKEFIQELELFGNFIHGTHVAGIAAKDAPEARIMAAKIIPTQAQEVIQDMQQAAEVDEKNDAKPIGMIKDFLIKLGLEKLADLQMNNLKTVGQYVAKTKMKVANCSFGTSMEQARMIIKQLLPVVIGRDATDEEVENYAKFFMNKVVDRSQAFVDSAKDTFFVMAAGNDGTDNDKLPIAPANIKKSNVITVAASFGYNKLAAFSNFGKNMVDIAAPGVAILSTIPGNEYLKISGTSQATPFVANVIGKIIDINPKLSFNDIRLLLMYTVDKKAFLADKVASGGIVNAERALVAAKNSLSMPLPEALTKANQSVLDVASAKSASSNTDAGWVMPLTPMFLPLN